MSDSEHALLNPEELGPASGFSHVVQAATGCTLYLAGQVGCDATGTIVAGGIVNQLDMALGRVVTALAAAGGDPETVVALTLFTTEMAAYRAARAPIGTVYRAHFGRHYPAMTLVGVTDLADPAAVIEISAIAVIPDATADRAR
ncbi:MAG: RidA family protein [Candidatus Dormibacteria bacterium]